MERGVRHVAVLGAAALGVFVAGCQSQVSGAGSFAGSQPVTPAGSAAATASATPSATPSALPSLPSGSAVPTLPTFPTAFAGTWSGAINQPGSKLPHWTADLTMPAGQVQGTFAVRGHCAGILTLLAGSASMIVAVERITTDPRNVCANSGGLTLRMTTAGHASLSWFDNSDDTNVASGSIAKR